MVTRKPVPTGSEPSAGPAEDTTSHNPPYPSTPIEKSESTALDLTQENLAAKGKSHSFDLIEMDEATGRPRRDSDVSSHGTWDSETSNLTLEEVEVEQAIEEPKSPEIPQPLRIRASQQTFEPKKEQPKTDGTNEELPAILRPGPNPKNSLAPPRLPDDPVITEPQTNPWRSESTNPYLRKLDPAPQSSQAAWADSASQEPLRPTQAPPPIPSIEPMPTEPVELPVPINDMEKLSIAQRNQPKPVVAPETVESLAMPEHFPGLLPPINSSTPAPPAFPSTNPWRSAPTEPSTNGAVAGTPPGPPPKAPLTSPPLAPLAPTISPPTFTPSTSQQTVQSPVSPQGDELYESPSFPPPGAQQDLLGDHHERPVAPAPPPISTQTPPQRTATSPPETPGTRDRRQRSEHYQIKHITWSDDGKIRRSPVLTQNANGPCPLLALVNALVLSTPADLDTALTEALRTREQVSLGLLLDAVFDELMSGRRGETAYQLPDVTELYAFLLALHTGMNVNPSFVSTSATSQAIAGRFEETKEMRLYSTFNIPLTHGWMPARDSAAYVAFERSAHTFEDAQNIQFLEAELEDKLRAEGLDSVEQQSLQDIQTIKAFLSSWPTQLTEAGLESIAQNMGPGQTAILFRNDHFSTLYKEPRNGALMTLVTDTGYSSHEEIVWESLVDVNGAASEMFSGDFRTVSHGQDARLQSASSSTPPTYRPPPGPPPGRIGASSPPAPPLPGPRPTVNGAQTHSSAAGAAPRAEIQRSASEQEDHDLALALQLQEEEEDRQRQADERRRREQELSEQFLSNEEVPPAQPPRRPGNGGRPASTSNARHSRMPSSSAASRPSRVSVGNPRIQGVNRPVDNDEEAPPSYEEYTSDRPYRPGTGNAATTTGSPSQAGALNAYDALRRQQRDSASQSTISVNTTATANSRRQSTGARLQRRSPSQSQPGSPSAGYGPWGSQGFSSNTAPRPINGPQGASPIRDGEERCRIM